MQDVVLQKRALSNCWLQQLDAQEACAGSDAAIPETL